MKNLKFNVSNIPTGFKSCFKNGIKVPREIFPVGETKYMYAVLDSNVVISCSVDKKTSNYI